MRVVEYEESASLLEVARNKLGLDSASRACRDVTCGACRMLVDGAAVNACALAFRDVQEGARVEGYEDIDDDPEAERAAHAFLEERPTRCHQCTAGLAVTAVSLARAGKARSEEAVEDAVATASCSCTGRGSWRRALLA